MHAPNNNERKEHFNKFYYIKATLSIPSRYILLKYT